MELRSGYNKNNVIVVKLEEPDLEGLLINHDVDDNGSYSYMEKEFVDSVIDYLPEYAMGEDTTPNTPTELVPYLREAAKSVVKIKKIDGIRKYIENNIPYDDWDKEILKIYNTKGIFSELILHFILRSFKNTIPLISKIYFKDSFSHEAHGFDSVHVSDDNKLWLGETKFYSDGKSGIKALIDDLNSHFTHDYLKDQFVIINRALSHKNPEREDWICALNKATRLEEKFKMIIVPLLCIYENSTAKDYIDAINNGTDINTLLIEHFSDMKKYFDSNNDYTNKERLQTMLILLPVECKKRIVVEMLTRICNMQGI